MIQCILRGKESPSQDECSESYRTDANTSMMSCLLNKAKERPGIVLLIVKVDRRLQRVLIRFLDRKAHMRWLIVLFSPRDHPKLVNCTSKNIVSVLISQAS